MNLLQHCCCSVFVFFGHEACGILASQSGIEPAPPALEGEVLTTGLPGKSLFFFLNYNGLTQTYKMKIAKKQTPELQDKVGILI